MILSFSILSLLLIALVLVRVSKNANQPNRANPTGWKHAVVAAGGTETNNGLVIHNEGCAFRFQYISGGEGHDHIRVCHEIPVTRVPGAALELPSMVLREERDLDRLGKKLKLNHELQTGDSLFDSRIYIECNDRGSVPSRMLSSPDVRNGVTGLLALGYKNVMFRHHESGMVATWRMGSRAFTQDIVEKSIGRLTMIARGLPPFHQVPSNTQRPAGFRTSILGWLHAFMTLFLFIVAGDFWLPLGDGLDNRIALTAAVLFAAQAGLIGVVVKGSASALRHFTIGASSGLLMAPCLSGAFWYAVNGYNDTEVTVYERVLDHKRISKSDDSTSHYFFFDTIPGVEDSSIRVNVSASQFSQGSKGDVYELTVGAGNLGTPWLNHLQKQ